MTQTLVLTDDQARILATNTGQVELRDRRGNLLACIPAPLSAEEQAVVSEAKRRLASNQPRYSTEEVMRHLESLAKGR
jgi:hypothetical protein